MSSLQMIEFSELKLASRGKLGIYLILLMVELSTKFKLESFANKLRN